MNLINDIEHLLMVDEMYHCAFKKETEQPKRLHRKCEATYDSLNRTQEDIQESRLQNDQIQRDLNVPHTPSCMEKNHVHMVGTTLDVLEGAHVEDKHEEGAYLQMLVKSYDEENIGQALIEIERKDELFLDMGNMAEDIPIEPTIKEIIYPWIGWINISLK